MVYRVLQTALEPRPRAVQMEVLDVEVGPVGPLVAAEVAASHPSRVEDHVEMAATAATQISFDSPGPGPYYRVVPMTPYIKIGSRIKRNTWETKSIQTNKEINK